MINRVWGNKFGVVRNTVGKKHRNKTLKGLP